MVYIIGVDHLVQYNGPVPDSLRNEFRKFLVIMARDLHIEMIAEEFSEEALRDVYHATIVTAREAAEELGIEHRYCDPCEADLRKLGIPYFAEIRDLVKQERGITEAFIIDDVIRKQVDRETADLVRTYWCCREQFWYDRIRDRIDSRILFICGHEHAIRFSELLRELGHSAEIIDPFWEHEAFLDYRNLGLL